MKKNFLNAVILLIISAGTGYFSFVQYNNTQEFLVNSERTLGEIIDFSSYTDDDSDAEMYSAIYEFTNQHGEKITFDEDGSSSSPSGEVGDVVKVIYNPDTNEAKLDSFFSLYGFVAILGLSTIITFVMALISFKSKS
ncbi:MAG: hypothetical protein B6I18_06380 [Bacteroidetes bacterium 4572_112]|nr:MAG: hypothetical protein B6I18_06380 [Bacteroidetes bacterium 4572_112]